MALTRQRLIDRCSLARPGSRDGESSLAIGFAPPLTARIARLASLLALSIAASSASAGLRMSLSPMKVHLSAPAGGTTACAVNVFNNGDAPVRVVTQVHSWISTRTGGMDLDPADPIARSASAFVRPELSEFTVAAHSSRIVRIEAALPDSADGSYWTMVYFECEGADRARGIGVATKLSLGTNVYLTARGSERRDDAISAMDAVPADSIGALALSFALENRGNVYHYPTGWLQVRQPGDQGGFEEKLPLRVLLPGTDTVYRTLWHPPASGTYQFVVTLDLGLDSLVQGVKEFTVGPNAPAIAPTPVDASPALPGGVDPRRP